jgi:hypothetical protein
MHYNLWETDTGNYFSRYENEAEALALVRTPVRHYGIANVDELRLGRVNDDGSLAEPLSGAELIARAREATSSQEKEPSEPLAIAGS